LRQRVQQIVTGSEIRSAEANALVKCMCENGSLDIPKTQTLLLFWSCLHTQPFLEGD